MKMSELLKEAKSKALDDMGKEIDRLTAELEQVRAENEKLKSINRVQEIMLIEAIEALRPFAKIVDEFKKIGEFQYKALLKNKMKTDVKLSNCDVAHKIVAKHGE